jgi:hypothetical protein
MKSNYRDQVQTHGVGWYAATWIKPGDLPSSVIFRFTEYRQNITVIPLLATTTDPTPCNVDHLFGVKAISKSMKSLSNQK